MELDYLFWNHKFQQHGSSHIHFAAHYSDIQNHTDGENDSEDQTETADELVYWGPNHQPELQEAGAGCQIIKTER